MTGMRRGELVGLRWSDVDLDGARLNVRNTITAVDGELIEGTPKTARSRRTPRPRPGDGGDPAGAPQAPG